MCNRCGNTPFINYEKVAQKQSNGMFNAMLALGTINLAFGIGNLLKGDDEDYNSYTPRTREVEKETEIPVEEKDDYREEVENLLGKDTFNALSTNLQEDILLKYDVLKSVRKLDDEVIKIRLNTYIQATQGGEQREAVKNFVKTTLSEASITYDEALIDNIIEKNNLLELFDPTGNDESKKRALKQKIIDYTNGLNYVAAERQLANETNTTFTHQGIKTAIDNNDSNTYKNAHLQFGQEMIEVYDVVNPDGKIDFVEFAAYQAELNNVENVTEEITEAARVLFNIQDMNSDGYIDQNEMSADLWTTATILDTKDTRNTSHEITQEEYNTTLLGKQAYGTIMLLTEYTEGWENLSDEEREAKYQEAYNTLDDEEKAAYQKYATSRKNAIAAFLPQS